MVEYIEREAAINVALMDDIDKDFPRMDIAARLHDIPAADVRPVKSGWWSAANTRPRTWSFRCSECGDIAYYPIPKYFPHGCGYKFCPNCGVRMEES